MRAFGFSGLGEELNVQTLDLELVKATNAKEGTLIKKTNKNLSTTLQPQHNEKLTSFYIGSKNAKVQRNSEFQENFHTHDKDTIR